MVLGLESVIFYAVLRDARRLPRAFALACFLFVISVLTFVTDMPGYFYIPGRYQLALTVTLGIAWDVAALTRAGRGFESSK